MIWCAIDEGAFSVRSESEQQGAKQTYLCQYPFLPFLPFHERCSWANLMKTITCDGDVTEALNL